jgi:hypothetical protein
MARKISEIYYEIKEEWKVPHVYAAPYLSAMKYLNSIDDQYINDSGRSIVTYFLSNAGTWRGDVAKRVKKELKDMIK